MGWARLCILLSSALLLFTSCTPQPPSSPALSSPAQAYHRITPQQAKQWIDEGGVTVVDVRRREEDEQGHIPGALILPGEEIGSRPPAQLPDQGAVLLVYCRSGVRSKAAAQKLAALGYRSVYDLGGILDWPYETTTGEE